MKKVYVIGSLRNPKIPEIANELRKHNLEVFDDWYAAGPEADDKWKEYEQGRGRRYEDALGGAAATNVYEFDKRNLDSSDAVVLVLPAGRSGHLEFGYCRGQGKAGYILLEDGADPRWDVMYKFATKVVSSVDELVKQLVPYTVVPLGQWQPVSNEEYWRIINSNRQSDAYNSINNYDPSNPRGWFW